jgi:hypothetical protein
MDGVLAIACHEAKDEAKKFTSLEDMLRAAMKAMTSLWVSTDDDLRFRASVGGVLMVLDDRGDDEAAARINSELEALRSLSALLSGVPVDMDRVTMPENPIGLMKMWGDVKAGGG